MLQPSGQIANYGGQKYQGQTLLEPVNVIIVDPTSTSAAAAKNKLTTAMTSGGFPAQTIHSGGFKGIIDGKTYQQQPTGFLEAFSNNSYTQTNDHGRIFGLTRWRPAAVTSGRAPSAPRASVRTSSNPRALPRVVQRGQSGAGGRPHRQRESNLRRHGRPAEFLQHRHDDHR